MLNDPVAVGPGRPPHEDQTGRSGAHADAVAAPGPPTGGGVAPRVVIGDERRPEATTRVSLAEFEGPLGLLLALIEARELDVLTVPLGALAESYLEALATVEVDRLGSISAFVAVASQLIVIKSRAMLPRQVRRRILQRRRSRRVLRARATDRGRC